MCGSGLGWTLLAHRGCVVLDTYSSGEGACRGPHLGSRGPQSLSENQGLSTPAFRPSCQVNSSSRRGVSAHMHLNMCLLLEGRPHLSSDSLSYFNRSQIPAVLSMAGYSTRGLVMVKCLHANMLIAL